MSLHGCDTHTRQKLSRSDAWDRMALCTGPHRVHRWGVGASILSLGGVVPRMPGRWWQGTPWVRPMVGHTTVLAGFGAHRQVSRRGIARWSGHGEACKRCGLWAGQVWRSKRIPGQCCRRGTTPASSEYRCSAERARLANVPDPVWNLLLGGTMASGPVA